MTARITESQKLRQKSHSINLKISSGALAAKKLRMPVLLASNIIKATSKAIIKVK